MTSAEITKSLAAINAMDDRNRRNLTYLENDLKEYGSVIPFVGAGLSIPLGFPGWTRFLIDEATRIAAQTDVERLIGAGLYEEAAELLRDRLGFREFEDALEYAFGEQKLAEGLAKGNALLSIPALTKGPVITTNFDRALEKVFKVANWPFVDKVWGNSAGLVTRAIVEDDHTLLKLHGDIADLQGRVLTFSEYQEHYGSGAEPDYQKPLPKLLRRLFESRPVLFVGCSLNNDRTLLVLKPTATEANMRHYAIVEGLSDVAQSNERRRQLSNFGIRAILYPPGEHQHVAALLAYLASQLKAHRSTSGEGPQGPPDAQHQEAGTHGPGTALWGSLAWSYLVHEHLSEKLGYYLVRTRPYSREFVRERLELLIAEHRFGTIRAFELFGNYDLMIRAWIPANAVFTTFPELLAGYLKCEGVLTFVGTAVHRRWYVEERPQANPKIRKELLAHLNPNNIKEVESGNDPEFLELLRDNGLVFERKPLEGTPITFFVSVNFETDLGLKRGTEAVEEIINYLAKNPALRRVTVDRGLGFSEILIKAESDDFYEIGKVPTTISKMFPGRAITETYLSKHRVPVMANGRIGLATFDALRGKNLYVAELLPELYPKRSALHDDVEAFLQRPEYSGLTTGARNFIHDFMLGVLSGQQAGYASVLYRAFSEWETFLRDNHLEFLGRRGLNVAEIYKAVNIPEKISSGITLVDALQVYSRALAESPEFDHIKKDWQAFTNARNITMHNKKELDDWRVPVEPVVASWPRITALICLVQKVTKSVFRGAYAEKCLESSRNGL